LGGKSFIFSNSSTASALHTARASAGPPAFGRPWREEREIMREARSVTVDAVSESPVRQNACDAIVLIDVLCDTTTLVTSVGQGRQTVPTANAPAALQLARTLREPLLAASDTETWRAGFEMFNSPSALDARSDLRPLVLSCWVGATLAEHAHTWPEVYLACFRNLSATARHLALRHERVLILNAPHDSDVRCEDQLAAGRLVSMIADAGFVPAGIGTRETVDRWGRADFSLAAWGRSAEELRRRRRNADVEFVLSHIDDLDTVAVHSKGRLVHATAPEERIPALA
jgi:phosphosulfolactate phosphohydrolase-like enzyme